MIFNTLFKWKTTQKAEDPTDAWEISEKPIYDHEADHQKHTDEARRDQTTSGRDEK